MNTPLSREVSAGDLTTAAQYNNLRTDALCPGGNPDTDGTLGQLLRENCTPIRFVLIQPATIGIAATPEQPSLIMIGGKLAMNTTSVTISVDPLAFTAPVPLYLYAAALAGGGYQLAISAIHSAHSDRRMIGCFFWDGAAVTPGSLQTAEEMAQPVDPSRCDGRLSLSVGQPFPETDIESADTLYFTPCGGNFVSLYFKGIGWRVFRLSEQRLPLSGLEVNACYDVFIRPGANGAEIALNVWGGLSARSQALARQDGVLVDGADPSRRYVGTFALDGPGVSADCATKRLVWNYYHRRHNRLFRGLADKTDQLIVIASSGRDWRGRWIPYLNDPDIRVTVVNGLGEDCGWLEGSVNRMESYISSGFALAGIAEDMPANAPYAGLVNNADCSPIVYFNEYYQTSGVIRTRLGRFRLGKHRYGLIFYTSAAIGMSGNGKYALGERLGLMGEIIG